MTAFNPETSVAGAVANDPVAPAAGQPGVLTSTRKPHLVLEPRSGWAALNLVEVWQYRGLLLTLAVRDVKLRYKQTALGVMWVVLQPLIAATLFSLIFGRLAGLSGHGVPYFVLAFAGTMGFNAFNSTLTKASTCLLDNSHMVAKIYFPRLILPLSTVLSTLIDFSVAMAVMVLLLIRHQINPGWPVLLLPLWVFLLVLLSIGIGLYTSALMVTYRDLRYVIPVILNFLVYASPVGYTLADAASKDWRLRKLMLINPLTGPLEAVRWSLLGIGEFNWKLMLYSVVMGGVLFILGAMAFKRLERRFADVI